MLNQCKIKLKEKEYCKKSIKCDGLCQKHLDLGFDKYSYEDLCKLTYCSKCKEFIQFNRVCVKCGYKQCKAPDRTGNHCRNPINKESPNTICDKHIEVGLDKLTDEQLASLEVCGKCINRYKLDGRCLACHKSGYCKANNQKEEPCQFSPLEGKKFCKDHFERYGHYTDEEFKQLKHCKGMCKMYFLPTDDKMTCPKCLNIGSKNRAKAKEKQRPCLWKMKNKMCDYKASGDTDYCYFHLSLHEDQKLEQKLGVVICKSKFSCRVMIPKEEMKNQCDECRERLNEYRRLRVKYEPYRNSPEYKLAVNSRTRLKDSLKSQKSFKTLGTSELVGCSYKELMDYLEKKFLPEMKWEYLGNNKLKEKCDLCGGIRTGIHIDHIKPLASYDLSKEGEQKVAFHYSNLQPMWGCCNIRKSDSLELMMEEDSV